MTGRQQPLLVETALRVIRGWVVTPSHCRPYRLPHGEARQFDRGVYRAYLSRAAFLVRLLDLLSLLCRPSLDACRLDYRSRLSIRRGR